MTVPNGHAATPASNPSSPSSNSISNAGVSLERSDFSSPLPPEKVKEFVAALEIPFDPAVIEWRVTNTSKSGNPLRGQVVPYADQRAYTDRLNTLFTPAGWTRRYQVHTSANFERSRDKKTVAKVLVTCELVIFGLGSHSATGEEWGDDDNAATSAEAQSFKRSASCFGLGRYLYFFAGQWVDLDKRKRPKKTPTLPPWATPDGWRRGLRPTPLNRAIPQSDAKNPAPTRAATNLPPARDLVRSIEQMHELLGSRLYGALLQSAKVRSARELPSRIALERMLAAMQNAARGVGRLKAAVDRVGKEPLARILKTLGLESVREIGTLQVLKEVVDALEAQTRQEPMAPRKRVP